MRLLRKIALWFVAILAAAVVVFVAWSNYRAAAMETVDYDDGAPGRYIDYKGHRWHVLVKGDPQADPTDAPILLIHGFIASGGESFLTFKDKLAEHRSLIVPDLLSYGHSERVTVPGEYYTLPHSAAAMAAILDELGVEQVDVVAHSYGTIVTNQLALDFPHRVRKIVLMGAMDTLPATPVEGVIQLPLGIGRAVAWHVVAGGPGSYPSMLCRTPPDCPEFAAVRIKNTTDSLRAAMYVTRATPYFADLPTKLSGMTKQVLVLNGEDDFLISPQDSKRLVERLPNAQLVLMPGANHMPYRQKPDEVLKVVTDFLQPST